MGKQIRTWEEADQLLLGDIRRKEAELAKSNRPAGKDAAVVAAVSERDRAKFVLRRLN